MKTNKLKNIKSTGFKAPDGYFKSLEDQLTSRIQEDKVLNDITDSGFSKPENYLNTLEDSIIDKISANKEIKIISLINRRTVIYTASVAAAIIILFGLTLTNNDPSFNSLETATVENYLLDENITSYEIASLLTEEELLEDLYIEHDLKKEKLEDFLLENVTIDDLIIE